MLAPRKTTNSILAAYTTLHAPSAHASANASGSGSVLRRSFSSSADGASSPELAKAEVMRPKNVPLAMDKLVFSFARSSGPGGQNVNKLNTKAELRFNVDEAVDTWIPRLVAGRLKAQQANRINLEGELLITAQEHRTQHKNKELCVVKLREMLAEAYVEPKERKMREGISKRTKANRKDDKRHRSSVKANRRSNSKDYD
jgi:ribosome-associated protein